MWRSNASWHTSKFPLFGRQGLKSPRESCKEVTAALLRTSEIPSLTKIFPSFRAGEVKLTQQRSQCSGTVPQRAGEQEAWSPQCHCRGRGGFTPRRVVALLPFSSFSPCRCSYTCLTILHKGATAATWTLSRRTVWKREFLICGKFQHSEICFSSAYKWEAKIPWSLWNGSPGEEREEGMEKIKKLPFEEKKIKILLTLFWWTLPLFNIHGDQTRPLRRVSKFAAHRESERDAWKTNK